MNITVALAKGRLAEKSIAQLEKAGLDLSFLKVDSRKLIFTDEKETLRFIFVKPLDVPTYVEHGVADIGICGKDTILESESNIYELLDLGFSGCRLVIAGRPGTDFIGINNLRVATKYVNCAKKYFAEKQQNIEIIKLSGSVELGPVIGLSDVILDIVESGRTLAENDLAILDEVATSSARFVVNKVSLKTKREVISPLIQAIKKALARTDD
jgi:ATP phosphoribosyltransferase